LAEYEEAAEAQAEAKRKEHEASIGGVIVRVDALRTDVDALQQVHVPTPEEIESLATEIAQKYIKPPVVTNQIVKETVVEKPQIIKETVHTTERVEYEDGALWAELGFVRDQVEQLPKIEPIDQEVLKKEINDGFKKDIAVMQEVVQGMPDFRKLGMGLQQQIDTKIEGVNVNRIIYSSTEPVGQPAGTIWISPA
jgi:hypothetical protein